MTNITKINSNYSILLPLTAYVRIALAKLPRWLLDFSAKLFLDYKILAGIQIVQVDIQMTT